ncbi:MAG: nucleotidyltransferase domain-containing protein [Halorhabdus sp.]
MEGDDRPELFDVLEGTVCDDEDVVFAVAFGSRISGDPTATSDLDLAVKFSADLSARDRFEKQCFLSGDIQREDVPFVDVSDIETLPLAVAHDAVNGRFVCGDRDAFERFKRDIESAFADQRESLRRQQRDVIDRIAEEGLHG